MSARVLKQSVSNQISRFDSSIDTRGMSLEALISLCEQRVVEEEKIRETRRQIERSLNESEIRLKRTQDDLKSVHTELSSWSAEWRQAIAGLGLKADAYPELATQTFDNLVSFFDKFDKSEELRKRIYGMDQVEEEFGKKVHEFAEAIGFKREGQEASTIVAQLHRDLNAAREARASLTRIEDQLKEIKQDIEDADITIRNSKRAACCIEGPSQG